MSPEVKKRVRALKRLILAQNEIKLRFEAEVHLLKLKYQKVYEPYINKQTDIIQGNYEPTKGEYSSSDEEDVQVPRYDELGEIELESCRQEPKGIPDFWFVYMENSYKFKSHILPHDKPIIRHLSDIRCNRSEEYIGFTMEFHFTPNEWFTNNVLTLKFEEDPPDNIFDFVKLYGVENTFEYKLTGCEINWNEGKNVTQQTKNVTLEGTEVPFNKTIQYPSFFNLFNDKFNLTNPDRWYFQTFFKQYNHQCNWLVNEAFMNFYFHHAGILFGMAETFDLSEDYETSESFIETDGEDDKCTSHSQMK
ncbi:nucleosome assembly protein 1-like 1 [Metopolophium dirhodum]|uniref:nucleosome assembly protein 1-like 1 n=1 Tax=Metopolophium dirhodum TaxID=44670 RepID=UPI00298F45A2|nr:nucleosome assembly protein 1-like 1 [Metopolophium dirhodum]